MANRSQEQHARFWKKYTLLTCGRIDTFHAIEVIIEEIEGFEFKATIQSVYNDLRNSKLLSEALDERPDAFCLSVRELVRSAKKTGASDNILPVIVEGLQDGTFI